MRLSITGENFFGFGAKKESLLSDFSGCTFILRSNFLFVFFLLVVFSKSYIQSYHFVYTP